MEGVTITYQQMEDWAKSAGRSAGYSVESSLKWDWKEMFLKKYLKEVEVLFMSGYYPLVDPSTSGVTIYFRLGLIPNLGHVTRRLRVLTANGFKIDNRPDFDDPSLVWRLGKKIEGATVDVAITAHVETAGPEEATEGACVMVKVGEKVVDDMKLVCPGSEDYEKFVTNAS